MMRPRQKLLLTAFIFGLFQAWTLSTPTAARAQSGALDTPVSTEMMLGGDGYGFELYMRKKLQSIAPLGFASITEIDTDWGADSSRVTHQGHATLSILSEVDLDLGYILRPGGTVRPSAGASFAWGGPELSALLSPRIDLHDSPIIDLRGRFEFRPALGDELRLYTRAQGLWSYHIADSHHLRSNIRLRAGLTARDISFGLAANLEFWGSDMHNQNNLGGFVLFEFF